MQHEPGDEYIRRIATYIRANEAGLAAAGVALSRRRSRAKAAEASSIFNPLGWFDTSTAPTNVKPAVLAFDIHHLCYLLIRMEALGYDVGRLDVKVENPSRPMNYISIPGADRSDALSFRSFTSTLTAVSRLSLGAGWWGRPAPVTLDAELKYIYSSFTILPALRIHAPEPRMISELANDPIIHALPLYAFKSLQLLECVDVDPRTLTGWDKLSVSLKSLSIKRSGLEDVSDVFINAVLDDQARSEGRAVIPRMRSKGSLSHQGSFRRTRLPETVPEDAEDAPSPPPTPGVQEVSLPASTKSELPSLSWSSLRHLSLAENALTFLPPSPLPYLTSVNHLDLSSNLLVSVPSGLSTLYSLVSLNLSDNMIDSVLGIYTMLGQILRLNLSRNRLESICGLERLLALERVDLRHNIIEESAEIGRLATLPNISEVWVEGNPLTEIEEGYRIRCFDLFWKEGKTIVLDGSPPGFYEKRYLTSPPPEQMASARTAPTAAPSPPSPKAGGLVVPALPSPEASPSGSAPNSQGASPQTAAMVARGRKKKSKRIVDLDGGGDVVSSRGGSHARSASERDVQQRTTSPAKPSARPPEHTNSIIPTSQSPLPVRRPSTTAGKPPSSPPSAIPLPPPKFVSRHTRRQTEFSPPTPPPERDFIDLSSSPSANDRRTSSHRRSATMSSKSTARRGRVSASMYEPPTPGGENGDIQFSEAEAFRQRIEALRSDLGEGWLKVFNQSHLASPKPTLPGVASG
ncbi:hypothetical protein BDY19DRAFT_460943 [Irpex rosettiformis]|uniref:Uncharacterized protein n=1 Tax=Irpex rosettiformis TaxID=378272 RepID=A0ACB8TT72_9APHY|nr:hypothetical protein BDY19DRAFT_460943 [Irpex rosettiformis]